MERQNFLDWIVAPISLIYSAFKFFCIKFGLFLGGGLLPLIFEVEDWVVFRVISFLVQLLYSHISAIISFHSTGHDEMMDGRRHLLYRINND
jgi:hypothetical protein